MKIVFFFSENKPVYFVFQKNKKTLVNIRICVYVSVGSHVLNCAFNLTTKL